MTKMIFIGIGLAFLLISAAFVLARLSQAAAPHPETKDRLKDCPDSPNCASSETQDIDPIAIGDGDYQYLWTKLQQTIVEQGGQLVEVQPHYLSATFKTPVFGFIDDLEARVDLTDKVIHLRSASRVGYYDFGTNRKRLLNLKSKMQVYLKPTLLENTHE